VLEGAGEISRESADRHAQEEYALFEEHRRAALERGALKQLEEVAKKLKDKS